MTAAHLSPRRLRAVGRGAPSTAAETAHAARCRACRGDLLVQRAMWIETATAGPSGKCPDAGLLVRYAEGDALSTGERRGLSMHVAACGRCAGDLEGLGAAAAAARSAPVARPASPAAGLRRRLQALPAWSMPPSLAVAVRGRRPPLPGFQAAMQAYRGGRYGTARTRLARAQQAGEDAPELDFYLGCCWLAAGEPERAAACLAAAVRRRPGLGEYHYHLACARLAAGEVAASVPALERAAALPGPHREAARRALAAAGGRGAGPAASRPRSGVPRRPV